MKTTLTLDNGKYKIIDKDDGTLTALRYDDEWRDLTGDKLVGSLFDKIEDLETYLNRVKAQLAQPIEPAQRIIQTRVAMLNYKPCITKEPS